jgi:large subunit ribosomal protein L15
MSEDEKTQKPAAGGLNLSDLGKIPGTRRKKRLGRGIGSGKGKTSGKGQKGQKSRSGGAPPAWFEGGQNPLYRRVPKKKGFSARPKPPVLEINLARLEQSDLTDISIETLKDAGLLTVKRSVRYYTLKVLGYGDISRALNIQCHAISEGAKAKVEKAGGKVELLEKVYSNHVTKKEQKTA